MKFRDEKVDEVFIVTGNAKKVGDKIKEVGKKHTIVDLQYGFATSFGELLYSALILARKK